MTKVEIKLKPELTSKAVGAVYPYFFQGEELGQIKKINGNFNPFKIKIKFLKKINEAMGNSEKSYSKKEQEHPTKKKIQTLEKKKKDPTYLNPEREQKKREIKKIRPHYSAFL